MNQQRRKNVESSQGTRFESHVFKKEGQKRFSSKERLMQQNCQVPIELRNDETKMRQNDILRLAQIKEANLYDIRGIEEQEFSPIDK